MKKVKFGIIGNGHAANLHKKAIEQIECAELMKTELTQELYRQWVNECDAICICTPHGSHIDYVDRLFDLDFVGRIIIEKPVSTRKIQTNPKRDEHLIPVLQNRYNPLIKALHKAVKQARFGKIFMINGSVLWNRNNNYYEQSNWRGTAEHKDGVLLNQAIHTLDLMQLMGGGIRGSSALMHNFAHKIDMEDTMVGYFQFTDGAVGDLKATTCMYKQNHETRIEVLGTHGTAIIGGKALNEVIEWDFAIEQPEDRKIKLIKDVPLSNDYGEYQGSGAYHKEFLEDVCDCILNNKPNPIKFEEALVSLNCVLYIYRDCYDNK